MHNNLARLYLSIYLSIYLYIRDWFGLVDRASACRLKGPGFDSGQGHVSRLWARPRWGVCVCVCVCVQEAAGRCFSVIDVSSSLSLSLPLCKKSIKYILKKRKNVLRDKNYEQQKHIYQ